MRYGIPAKRIQDIATLSPQYMRFAGHELTERMEQFLRRQARVLLGQVSFRPEYRARCLARRHASVPGVRSRLRVCLVGIFRQRCLRRKNFAQGWPEEVSASVLESLALGVALVASENGRGPAAVVTYQDANGADMVAKLRYVTEPYSKLKCGLFPETRDDKSPRRVAWLLQNHRAVV